jgi:hypothetical protein
MRRDALANDINGLLLVEKLLVQFCERAFDERRRFHAVADVAQNRIDRFELFGGSGRQLRGPGLRRLRRAFVRMRVRMLMLIHADRFRLTLHESYDKEAFT